MLGPLHPLAAVDAVDELGGRLDAGVGHEAQGEHLPQEDPVGPDIRLRGEYHVSEGLWCHPLDREGGLPVALAISTTVVDVPRQTKVGNFGAAIFGNENVSEMKKEKNSLQFET